MLDHHAPRQSFFLRYPVVTLLLLLLGLGLFGAAAYSFVTESFLFHYDQPVLERMTSLHEQLPAPLNTFLEFLSLFGNVGSSVIAVFFGIMWWHNHRQLRFFYLLASYLGGVGLFFLLLFQFDRQRPVLVGLLELFPLPAFPSGHVFLFLALFIPLLYVYLPTIKWPVSLRAAVIAATLVVVLGIGLERLLVGTHHVTDVIAGLGLGIFWPVLLGTGFEIYARQKLR